MGLFSQKQQDPAAWAALPGEPLDETNPNERLDETPPVDLLGLGLGGTSTVITISSAEPGASAEPDAPADPHAPAEAEVDEPGD